MAERQPAYCSSLVFMPDGLHAVSESGGNFICVWDLKERRREQQVEHGYGKPFANIGGMMAVPRNGSFIAAAAVNPADKNMQVLGCYDPKSGERLSKAFGFSGTTGALAFSPDSSRLAVAVAPGLFGFAKLFQPFSIAIFDVQTGKQRGFDVQSPAHSLAFAPDGKRLLVGSANGQLRLWLPDVPTIDRNFKGHAGLVGQVAFARDGKRVFSASAADGTLRVWENDQGAKELQRIDSGKAGAPMTCTAFWPGHRAVTGHADGTVVVWDLATGKESQRFARKDARVTAVAISPDGFHAVAALSDGQVYLYRLPPPSQR